MKYYGNILETIGRTPLVKLSRVADGLPATILAKVEYFNPGGSVKDRIGLNMVEDAERRGLLRPGGTIIEATAGNTGVGLALIAAQKGYRCIFVMPDKMSDDKVNLLKAYGAEVVITPTSVPPDSPESYNGVAETLAREVPGAFRPNQFGNAKNPEAHYNSTGPEIWEDTEGKVDVFVASMGTGGTISGTARFLKEKNPEVTVVGADPAGSILSGDAPRPYRVEGIGEDFIPATFDRQAIDEMVRVTDAESFTMARRLAREEGILAGGSSGTAVAAAVRYSLRLAPGKLVVVLLPDTGRNYLTKIFSDAWMRDNGLLADETRRPSVGEALRAKSGRPGLISIGPGSSASEAAMLMEMHGISQLPVMDRGWPVGSLTEMSLVKALHDGASLEKTPVSQIMGRPLPAVDASLDISEAYRLLLSGHGGIMVKRKENIFGFLTKIDLINYLADKSNIGKEAER